ncbi:hypothetical protein BS47DRAFT_1488923 [Hydnum rufescens UP504]|uniref:Bromo domain-containing protein n=1 Tax=Hydnum rufescens UP504 TaxID=1448309 RepID=A0A9P6DQF3_9AGAM|nr:hypothetical protein BS47DRAFT_1488923 [Hydnum rufescens UP504]
MAINATQKQEILQVLDMLYTYSVGRRTLSAMFKDLPDPQAWPAYYEVIPQPRSLETVKVAVEKDKFRNIDDVRSDLELIFANALHFNEEGSVISLDAKTLQGVLEHTWSNQPSLQRPAAKNPASTASTTSPPAGSNMAQTLPMSAGTPAPQDEEMDPNLEILVRRTEAKMEIWAGPVGGEGMGWMAPIKQADPHARYLEIISLLKNYRVAATGDRPADALEKLPESTNILFLYHNDPISFALIESRAHGKFYGNAQSYDIDLFRLFEKGRRTYQGDPLKRDDYGRVLLLQRMWQHLTSPHATSTPAMTRAHANFASISAGPGTAKAHRSADWGSGPGPTTNPSDRVSNSPSTEETAVNATSGSSNPGSTQSHNLRFPPKDSVTTFRIPSKDRDFTEKAVYKGCTYQIGDYVHLINPDDASRPIVGHIFRTFIPRGKHGSQGVSVCWYNLPEQTVHSRNRTFYENEVLKTGLVHPFIMFSSYLFAFLCASNLKGQFADHTIEDILEKIGCQFLTKHIRGRPLPPLWHPGWPLYVCDQRYNDRDRAFVRIKNWASCIPEEIRSANFMPIQLFDETGQNRTVPPRKVKSPFLKGVKGPGMIGEEGKVEKARPVKDGGSFLNSSITRGGSGSNATADAANGAAAITVDLGSTTEVGANINKPKRHYTKRGTIKGMPGVPSTPVMRDPSTKMLGGQALDTSESGLGPAGSTINLSFQNFPATAYQNTPKPHHQHKRRIDDRSIITAAGGMAYLSGAKIDTLPKETASKFDRDPKTGHILWFSGAPIDITPPTAYKPRHSLAYLNFLAQKRETAMSGRGSESPRHENHNDPGDSGTEGTDGQDVKRRKIDGGDEGKVARCMSEKSALVCTKGQLLDEWRVISDGSVHRVLPFGTRDVAVRGGGFGAGAAQEVLVRRMEAVSREWPLLYSFLVRLSFAPTLIFTQLFAIMLGTVGLGGYFLMYKAGKNAAEDPNRSLRVSSPFERPSNPRRIIGGEWRARNTTRNSHHNDDSGSPFKKTRDQEGSDLE